MCHHHLSRTHFLSRSHLDAFYWRSFKDLWNYIHSGTLKTLFLLKIEIAFKVNLFSISIHVDPFPCLMFINQLTSTSLSNFNFSLSLARCFLDWGISFLIRSKWYKSTAQYREQSSSTAIIPTAMELCRR